LTVPRRGRVTAVPAQRIVPVRRKESRAFPFFFRRGNPSLLPLAQALLRLDEVA